MAVADGAADPGTLKAARDQVVELVVTVLLVRDAVPKKSLKWFWRSLCGSSGDRGRAPARTERAVADGCAEATSYMMASPQSCLGFYDAH